MIERWSWLPAHFLRCVQTFFETRRSGFCHFYKTSPSISRQLFMLMKRDFFIIHFIILRKNRLCKRNKVGLGHITVFDTYCWWHSPSIHPSISMCSPLFLNSFTPHFSLPSHPPAPSFYVLFHFHLRPDMPNCSQLAFFSLSFSAPPLLPSVFCPLFSPLSVCCVN